ncbi:Holliday junction branch migration protein RuvA [Histidinibacterium aquaticum]|uniref:Holliday junction branch migration complex subunit RuvA n=1 Tax=Histidinibacterium aquaticum TaxID=2613962 RepID=A0A5J5GRE5_9RHOB|nr:Holliday junction branch migration protein RuvA [Histidinibacterium aquaticum]KAA9010293.1 Holliday junction branch migration protein RuvA [Histidinibacterium aquaticum]
MIGRLSGRLDYRAADHVLISVGGVGYVVFVSDRVMAALPGPGEAVSLYTDLLVREDLLQLFGFTTLQEKEWHRLLMSVQGIGAKASLAILGALGAEGVGRAVALGDAAAISAAKGVGPKTAERVVRELKDKAPSVMALGGTMAAAMAGHVEEPEVVESDAPRPAPAPAPRGGAAQSEALSALTNLGYGPSEAASAVAEAGEEAEDTAGLIRAALRRLAPKG